jgi:hypothetical protein
MISRLIALILLTPRIESLYNPRLSVAREKLRQGYGVPAAGWPEARKKLI